MLVVLTAVAFFVVVPLLGVDLPLIVPVMCFLTILVGSVLAHAGDAPEHHRPTTKQNDDCGCAVGCCPGPRPLKMFRDED